MHSDPSLPSSPPVPGTAPEAAGTPTPPPAHPSEAAEAPGPLAGAAAPVSAEASVPSSTALSIRGLRKSFSGTEVVHGLSLDVPQGSFYGIVGPNGAGKTTTLSMATGLLRPDGGTAHVLGHDMWVEPQAAKARLGVLADGLRTFDRLTGRELLTYVGLLRGMEPAVV